MQAKPRVLILARGDERAAPLARGLDDLGWRTVTARGPNAAVLAAGEDSIEAVVVDLIGVSPDMASVIQRIRRAGSPRRLAMIGVGDGEALENLAGLDLVLPPPLHPQQMAAKLEALVRLQVAEEQFELRRQTFAERGGVLERPLPDPAPLRILLVGEPAPAFLALSNALSAAGAEPAAALTAYTAFEYLHHQPFDAVALWSAGEPLAITAGMRRNTRLHHLPTILCLGRDGRVDAADAYAKGVSDIATQQGDEGSRARRILELARIHRRQDAIRGALEGARASGLMDPATGLFTRSLFAAHLARLAKTAQAQGRTLSVVALAMAETAQLALARRAGWLDRAIPQIGTMIARLVRVEDTAARLGAELFAVALPATGRAEAQNAAERIAAVIGCTAFEAGAGEPFVAGFEAAVEEVDAGRNVAEALERAAARAGGGARR